MAVRKCNHKILTSLNSNKLSSMESTQRLTSSKETRLFLLSQAMTIVMLYGSGMDLKFTHSIQLNN